MSRFVKKEVTKLAPKFNHIRMAENYLAGLKATQTASDNPGVIRSSGLEIERVSAALADIESRMLADDLAEYRAIGAYVKTAAELAAEAEVIAKAMEENRDSQSI